MVSLSNHEDPRPSQFDKLTVKDQDCALLDPGFHRGDGWSERRASRRSCGAPPERQKST